MKHPIIIRTMLLLFLSSATALLAADRQSIPVPQTALLSGVVMDYSESRIANAKLTIEGQGTTRTVVADEEGTYNVPLPPGLYKITANNPGFCPMSRAFFKAEPSANITINFIMLDCALEHALVMEGGQPTGEVDRYKMPFKEESFFVASQVSPPLDVLVQFGEKLESKNSVQYKGFKLSGDRQIGVTVSYNLLTVHADNICFNKTTFQFEAIGNVLVEDGSSRVQANQISVEPKSGQPIVKKIQ